MPSSIYCVYTFFGKEILCCIDVSLSSHQKQQQENSELMVKGVYGLVRHPMYTGVLITLWSQPTMVRSCIQVYGYRFN